jgi:hypothetical protein
MKQKSKYPENVKMNLLCNRSVHICRLLKRAFKIFRLLFYFFDNRKEFAKHVRYKNTIVSGRRYGPRSSRGGNDLEPVLDETIQDISAV